ncbi:efflux RND transporter permease subunit, partial [Rhizobium johnstonii]|uniref:efflux RND transporter permease subunit n=1 Tax=Rhizobium johnstonii TaxID=3019933 RepID=UPI003F954EA8
AIVLVFVVLLVFLQNLRATLIPTIAVPVVLLGTFGVLSVTGYSINTLTMAPVISPIDFSVASRGESFSSDMMRSTFST